MTFLERLLNSAVKSWSGLITLISFGIGIIGFIVTPAGKNLPMNWVVIVIFALASITIIFLRAALEAHNEALLAAKFPRVKMIIDPPKNYPNCSALLLLEPTHLLSYDSMISLYYNDSGIERLSGIGKVVNVQNDKMIQVILTQDAEFSEKISDLKKNNRDELDKLIVKPSIPSFLHSGV